MPIDPNIALGFRGVQAPDPLAQYGTLTQIQGAQQANALRGLQMRELEEGVARRNRLAAQLGAPEFAALTPEQQVNALTRGGFLTEARSLAESQSKVGKEQREAEKSAVDIAAANMKRQRDLLPAVKANPAAWASWRADTIKALPGLANIIPMQYSPEAADSLMLEADKALEKHFVTQNLGGTERVLAMPKYGTGAAAVVPGSAAAVQPLPADVEAQRARLNAAGAARQITAINTQLPASEEAQKEFMKEMRQTYSALKQAPTVLSNIEAAKKLIPQAKGFMGAGGEGVLQAASFLNNRLGTNINTEGVKSAEELRSRLFLGIMDNLKKLDSQPSQQQQAALQQALGSIGTDPNALPRVLDVFGETIRQKVDLYNEEAASAESRGVKFPYKPTITLTPRAGAGASTGAGAAPAGVDPALWNVMTPQERALWQKK